MKYSCRWGLLLLLLFFAATPLWALDGEMVVYHEGTTTTISLDDVISMRHVEDVGVVISADDEYVYSDGIIEKIIFTNFTDVEEGVGVPLPSLFLLGSAYPNPFNSTVTLPITLPHAGELKIRLVNLLGQTVYSGSSVQQAGQQRIVLDLRNNMLNLSSGVYLVRAEFAGHVQSSKLVFMK